MSEPVGTAYVRIRAITARLGADIKDGIDNGAKQANPDIERAGDAIGGSIGRHVKASLESSVTDALTNGSLQTAADGVGGAIGRSLTRGITQHVDRDGRRDIDSSFTRTFSRVTARARRTGAGIGSALFGSFAAAFNKKNRDSNPLGKLIDSLRGIRFTGIGALITIASPIIIGGLKAVSFYLVGIVALLGQVAQAALGAGAGVAGMFIGAVPGLILVAAALKRDSDALEAFKTRTQEFTKYWGQLVELTQANFLPLLGDAFQVLTEGMIPLLSDFAAQVGLIAGETARFAAATLTSERNSPRWRRFLVLSKFILEDLGAAIVYAADSLAPLFDALAFVGAQFSDTVRLWAKDWNEMIQASAASGDLGEMLQDWYDKAVRFFGALSDLVVGVWNALKIGADAANPAFQTFADFAERWREFTETPEGQNKLRSFFDNALEVMREVNLLFKDILELLFTPLIEGDTSNLIGGIQLLREEVLPAVVDLLRNITDNMDPVAIGELVTQITEFFSALSSAGFLAVYVDFLSAALEVITAILDTPLGPAAAQLIGFLWGLSTITKLPILGPALVLISKGLGAIAKALGTRALMRLFGTTVAVEIFEALGPALLAFATAAAPFVAAALAIFAALGALYFIFPEVRQFIDDTWQSLQDLADLIEGTFKGDVTLQDWAEGVLTAFRDVGIRIALLIPIAVGLALYSIARFFVRTAPIVAGEARKLFNRVSSVIATWVRDLPKNLRPAAAALSGWVRGAARDLMDRLNGVKSRIVAWTATLGKDIAKGLLAAGAALVDWVILAAKRMPYWFGYILGFIIGWLIRLPIEISLHTLDAAKALSGWVTVAAFKMLAAIHNFGVDFATALRKFVDGIPDLIKGAVIPLAGWVVIAINHMKTNLKDYTVTFATWAIGFVAAVPGRMAGAAANVINWVILASKDLPLALSKFTGEFYAWALGFALTVATSMLDAASALVAWIVNAVKKLPGAIKKAESEFLAAGLNIILGILDGLKDNVGLIWDWIYETFVGGFVDGIKDAIGIGDDGPSSATPSGGTRSKPKALAQELRETTKLVDDAFSRALKPLVLETSGATKLQIDDSSISKLDGITAGSSTIQQNFDFTVSIAPTEDMTPAQTEAAGKEVATAAYAEIRHLIRSA